MSIQNDITKWFLLLVSYNNYEGLLRHAMRSSILFKKFLPSIFSNLISLKAPPRCSHFLSWTSSLVKKSFLGDWAIKTWIPTDGSHLIASILSPKTKQNIRNKNHNYFKIKKLYVAAKIKSTTHKHTIWRSQETWRSIAQWFNRSRAQVCATSQKLPAHASTHSLHCSHLMLIYLPREFGCI